MFGDILTPDGKPSSADSRHVLKRALAGAKKDFGFDIFAKFVANKRQEIEDYRANVGAEFDKQVSPYEVERYLPFL